MYILLVVQSGFSSGRQVCLPRGKQVCVGRSSQADFAFAKDSFISGTHFLLENDDDNCWITDLNSRNGTYVNGSKVQRSRLNNGDTIMAGHTVFLVQLKTEDAEITRDASSHFSRARDTNVEPQPITSDITQEELAARHRQDRLLQLFRGEFQPLYAVLDQEADKKLLARIYSSDAHFESLGDHSAEAREDSAITHPKLYLTRLFGDSVLLDMLVREGWGRNWGIYVTYLGGLTVLTRHLYELLQAPTGDEKHFSYYNPRVLREYLQKCTQEEALRCMGPIENLLLEDEHPDHLLEFSRSDSGVSIKRIPLNAPPESSGIEIGDSGNPK